MITFVTQESSSVLMTPALGTGGVRNPLCSVCWAGAALSVGRVDTDSACSPGGQGFRPWLLQAASFLHSCSERMVCMSCNLSLNLRWAHTHSLLIIASQFIHHHLVVSLGLICTSHFKSPLEAELSVTQTMYFSGEVVMEVLRCSKGY